MCSECPQRSHVPSIDYGMNIKVQVFETVSINIGVLFLFVIASFKW